MGEAVVVKDELGRGVETVLTDSLGERAEALTVAVCETDELRDVEGDTEVLRDVEGENEELRDVEHD